MIEVIRLTKYYGNNLGIEDVSFSIKKGEIFGFVGKNGAGKSTTIRTIMNLINKNSGEVKINGKEFLKDDIELKNIIGYLPSEINLYKDMSVRDTFNYFSGFYKKDCTKKIDELVKRLDINLDKRIEELSLGNLKKVGIVLSLMHDPELIIMDEATSGLDPLIQEEVYKILLEEKEKNKAILFSSHNLNEIKKISDMVGVIKDGEMIKIDTVDNLIKNNYYVVKINTKDTKKIEEELGIKIKDNKFIYGGDINKLIKIISKYKFDNIYIEEPPIEDMFMKYYGGQND